MLSILIPVFNRDIQALVQDLSQQLSLSGIPYEILIADDGSDEKFYELNSRVNGIPNVRYHRHQENMGRSRIRNWLAGNARYPYLLFMDCDAAVVSEDFITAYLEAIDQVKDQPWFVISGGVSYQNAPPDSDYHLRWYYGKKREEIPAAVRRENPYKSFTPFNMLLTKSIFDTHSFYEELTTYGYEDTFFGLQLQNNRIPVYHIDNPLEHEGLDGNTVYIQKIESAIDNLVHLSQSGIVDQGFIDGHKLLKTYYRLKSIHLLKIVRYIYSASSTRIKNTLARKSDLFLLDFYKLGYLIQQLGA